MLCLSALLPGSAFAGCVQAFQSDKFVDSIGINTHLDYPNYTPWSTVEPILTNLGVRHIRWGFAPSYSQNQELVGLYAYGITANLCFDTLTSGTLDTSKIVSTLTSMDSLSYSGTSVLSGVESVEGPNEYDTYPDPAWLTDLTDYQQELYTDMAKDSNYDNIPALAPSMGLIPTFQNCRIWTPWWIWGMRIPTTAPAAHTPTRTPRTSLSPHFCVIPSRTGRVLRSRNRKMDIQPLAAPRESRKRNRQYGFPVYTGKLSVGIRRTFLYELIDEDLPSSTVIIIIISVLWSLRARAQAIPFKTSRHMR